MKTRPVVSVFIASVALTFLMVLVTHLSAAEPDALLRSTFNATGDTEGWMVFGNNPVQGGGVLPPQWVATGGVSGGFIRTQDQVGGPWYWQAPAKFRGNQSTYYNGTLIFHLQQNDPTSQFEAPDVILQGGPEGNRIRLVYNTTTNPAAAPAWSRYDVPLRPDVQWMKVTQGVPPADDVLTPATEADIRAALSNVTTLRIRGEYHRDDIGSAVRDIGGLDEVALAGPGETLPTPVPGSPTTMVPTPTTTTAPSPTATTMPSPTATTAPPLRRVYLPLVVK